MESRLNRDRFDSDLAFCTFFCDDSGVMLSENSDALLVEWAREEQKALPAVRNSDGWLAAARWACATTRRSLWGWWFVGVSR